MNTSPQGSGPGASPAKFMHWRRQADVVQDVSAYRSNIVNYTGGEHAGAAARRAGERRLLPSLRHADRSTAGRFPRRRIGRTSEESSCSRTASGFAASAATREYSAARSRSAASRSPSSASWRRDSISRSSMREPRAVGSFQFDPNTGDQGHYFAVAGAAEARRHPRSGEIEAAAVRAGVPDELSRTRSDRTRDSASTACATSWCATVRSTLLVLGAPSASCC